MNNWLYKQVTFKASLAPLNKKSYPEMSRDPSERKSVGVKGLFPIWSPIPSACNDIPQCVESLHHCTLFTTPAENLKGEPQGEVRSPSPSIQSIAQDSEFLWVNSTLRKSLVRLHALLLTVASDEISVSVARMTQKAVTPWEARRGGDPAMAEQREAAHLGNMTRLQHAIGVISWICNCPHPSVAPSLRFIEREREGGAMKKAC